MKSWGRKVIECSEFSELLCRSLRDKNDEGNAEDGGLACEVLEERIKTLLGSFVILWFWVMAA